jgi:hypothetical protein
MNFPAMPWLEANGHGLYPQGAEHGRVEGVVRAPIRPRAPFLLSKRIDSVGDEELPMVPG